MVFFEKHFCAAARKNIVAELSLTHPATLDITRATEQSNSLPFSLFAASKN
jgi:hypothetical protein